MPASYSSTPQTRTAASQDRATAIGAPSRPAAPPAADVRFLPQLRDLVEQRLAEYLSSPSEHSIGALHDGCAPRLREAMRYSLLAGGKRLRPVLVLLAADACGGSAEAALPAACAVEMIHTYSLIHDDLPAMDDDDLRRGRATSHKVFGEGMAILAGDALLTLAFEVLARDIQPADRAARCCAELASAAGACWLVGGQVADLAMEERLGHLSGAPSDPIVDFPQPDVSELEAIHRRKTGALIRVALRMGAIVAGADEHQLDILDRYGQALGLAFQVTDDLLDVRGNEETLGKRVGKDSGRGKLTYPGLLGIDESARRAEALAAEAVALAGRLAAGGGRLESLARFVLHRDR